MIVGIRSYGRICPGGTHVHVPVANASSARCLQSEIATLGERIETLDGRMYEMNERLTRVETKNC